MAAPPAGNARRRTYRFFFLLLLFLFFFFVSQILDAAPCFALLCRPFVSPTRVCAWVHSRLHFYPLPCVASITSPGIATRHKGLPDFRVSSERHSQMWAERNCLSFETAAGGIGFNHHPSVPSFHSLAIERTTTQRDRRNYSETLERLSTEYENSKKYPPPSPALPRPQRRT